MAKPSPPRATPSSAPPASARPPSAISSPASGTWKAAAPASAAQNVCLFADTIENNIKFGCPDATHEQVVEAARNADRILVVEAARNADRILVVEDGRIAECGTHDELMARGGLYRRFTEIRERAELWQHRRGVKPSPMHPRAPAFCKLPPAFLAKWTVDLRDMPPYNDMSNLRKGSLAMLLHKPRGQMSESLLMSAFVILSGGLQDAYTYLCRGGVFANAQTGNIVLFSTCLFEGDWHRSLHYLVPVLSFMLGIFVAECVHRRFKHMERVHWRQLILLAEIVFLFAVGFLPQSADTPANAVVSFVCAMQVQTFRKVRGHAYASTMCIGNMRSGTEALCVYFHTHDREVLHKALTYFGVIGVFAAGAGLGALLTARFGIRGIWLSCALLAVSFLIMFIHDDLGRD